MAVRLRVTGRPWELRIHGQDIEARLDPLEAGTLRVGDGPVRPLPTGENLPGVKLKTGLRPQALAFVQAVREVGQLTWPASDLSDHARSVALAEYIAQTSRVTTAEYAAGAGPGRSQRV